MEKISSQFITTRIISYERGREERSVSAGEYLGDPCWDFLECNGKTWTADGSGEARSSEKEVTSRWLP